MWTLAVVLVVVVIRGGKIVYLITLDVLLGSIYDLHGIRHGE